MAIATTRPGQGSETGRQPGITRDTILRFPLIRRIKCTKVLGVVCLMLVAGLLLFGLWPFHSPTNQVAWLREGNGVAFGRHGTLLSSGAFKAEALHSACSLEIWLEPRHTWGGGSLFVFYVPGKPQQLSLRQYESDLSLQIDTVSGPLPPRINALNVPDVFRQGKQMFVTVTSNGEQTSIYIDGSLARPATQFPLSSQDFEGELIVANAPVDSDSWSGLIRGLAFYRQELTPGQVQQHYSTWTTKGRPGISQSEHPLALYPFDEKTGNVIHSQVAQGPDLFIPRKFKVVDKVFLRSILKSFEPDWGYCQDVLINIGGFIPFGFIVCAYLSLLGRSKKPGFTTILFGFAISLLIESLQYFLPTRYSDITDITTNTLGTCVGVWIYRMPFWRTLLAGIWARLSLRLVASEAPTRSS